MRKISNRSFMSHIMADRVGKVRRGKKSGSVLIMDIELLEKMNAFDEMSDLSIEYSECCENGSDEYFPFDMFEVLEIFRHALDTKDDLIIHERAHPWALIEQKRLMSDIY